MRQLTNHIVEGDSVNHQLSIDVIDEPGQGGACHGYNITGYDTKTNPVMNCLGADHQYSVLLAFQNGPIKEVGVNGITHEALLAILIDRLDAFDKGPYSTVWNRAALQLLRCALDCLQIRTKERIARNVEGTHTV